ncbi:MAG: LacI family gluconate utilization system Gnt-I transcriptional repressor [Pseudorhodobacter sp.]|jgi:LacI family gluconate utilization system Gnt-I transcriptional repressor
MDDERRRPTLKEVAALSGVSTISASRVMSGGPNISDELRAKVEQAARTLGYQRNRIAGSLRGQATDLIAVIVPSMSNNVFPNFVDGLDQSLRETALRPVLGMTNYCDATEESVLRDMLSWNPAGIILAGLEHTQGTRDLLARYDGPIVEVMDVDGQAIDFAVGTSQIEAGKLIARHFIARGYRKIGYIGAWGERPVRSLKRRLAFEAELFALGHPIIASRICDEASSMEGGAREMEQLLTQHRDLDAVFFANDDLALGALFYCKNAGISVPGDVAIAGFNGLEMCQQISPRLTTIQTPRKEMGHLAGSLIRQHNREIASETAKIHKLPLGLIQGETT